MDAMLVIVERFSGLSRDILSSTYVGRDEGPRGGVRRASFVTIASLVGTGYPHTRVR